jgi:hypothetical protein
VLFLITIDFILYRSGTVFKIKANITEEERRYAKRESFLRRVECKVHDLENRTTEGFQRLSVLGILEKLIN